MNDSTDSSSSSKEERFRPQISGEAGASGSNENRRKKRPKLAQINDLSGVNPSSSSNPKPVRRSDPDATKTFSQCSECGKQFGSQKALYGHMRCHPERPWRGIKPPPNFQRPVARENPSQIIGESVIQELREIASSLVMLAKGPSAKNASCSTMARDLPESRPSAGEPSSGGAGQSSGLNNQFECSGCKKLFSTHQALGGHRASHKNVKGCFANARNDGEDEDHGNDGGGDGEVKESGEEKTAMGLGHKCSICSKVFSSGQALGGHKRRHWEKGDEQVPQGLNLASTSSGGRGLDLNLPAPIDDDEDGDSSSSSSSDLGLNLSDEEGLYYGLNLRGTNFLILRARLGGKHGHIAELHRHEVSIPSNLMVSTSGVGKDLVDDINRALEKQGVDMPVSALVNDTVGDLVGGRYYSSDTVVAVTLGMTTNAAYVEPAEAVPKWHGPLPKSGEMVINMEWGNFSSSHLPITEFDTCLDAESSNPGDRIFEKLISGMYLGEIVRRVLLKMAKETALFGESVPPKLKMPYVLRSPDMAAMHQDTSEDREVVGEKLECIFGITVSTPMVREVVAEVCDIVAERGARLAGAGIVGILKKLGRIETRKRSVVTVEGGLYEHYRLFRNYLHSSVWEMLGSEFSDNVVIEHSHGGSGIGAVLLAALPSRFPES
ncbi:hypothetical protein HHK36_031086 [Tetracentron sinense]|uniref:hexokinase n=1 Tax=Tetracentron sinense TaxID=13715 RepID=A0A834YCW2_TETSI|nr:hypothetical protein HHK36_031086 [Tetracentron sinense]